MRQATMGMIFIFAVCASAFAGDSTGTGIEWVTSFEKAAALAQKTNRHLVADFYTPT